MPGKIKIILFIVVGGFIAYNLFSGGSSSSSSSSSSARVVNLDTVLDTMSATLTELDGETTEADAQGPPAEDTPENAEQTAQVLSLYHTKINESGMQPDAIGISMMEDGAILGYNDTDGDNTKAATGEKDLFKVEIDAERSRLIATDLEHGYSRDHGIRWGGLLTGYFVGRMLMGQRSAGITSSKFANTKVSPRGYHKNAAASASSARPRARSSAGSRSFSTGK